MEAVGGQAGDLGTRRDADRVHHRTKASLKAAPVVESAAAGSTDTFRITDDGGDAQPNGDGAEAVPDGLARPIGDHEGVAGSGVAVDDLISSVGFIREVGDPADCRELLKDIERVVHDDDDAGSAEAHDCVAGSAKFTLMKNGSRAHGIAARALLITDQDEPRAETLNCGDDLQEHMCFALSRGFQHTRASLQRGNNLDATNDDNKAAS